MSMKSMAAAVSVFALLAGSGAMTLSAAAKPGNAAKGKEVFEQCGVCHAVDSDEKKMGPALKGLYKKDKMKNGKKPTDDAVKAIINSGGNGMPSYADMLSDEEKADVIAYLKTI